MKKSEKIIIFFISFVVVVSFAVLFIIINSASVKNDYDEIAARKLFEFSDFENSEAVRENNEKIKTNLKTILRRAKSYIRRNSGSLPRDYEYFSEAYLYDLPVLYDFETCDFETENCKTKSNLDGDAAKGKIYVGENATCKDGDVSKIDTSDISKLSFYTSLIPENGESEFICESN